MDSMSLLSNLVEPADVLSQGNINITATVILAICTALVLFMVPGLAIFYGGLVRRKDISMIMAQSFVSLCIVTIIWIFGGFGLAFGTSAGGFIGNPADYFCFRNILFTNGWEGFGLVVNTSLADGVPFILFFLFQLAFAIITPALVSGAFADRLSFRGYIIFTILFTIFVYIPVCHWIWGGGFLAQNGVIDWAGGIVIHATCGLAAIASVIVLKKRKILKNEDTSPNSIPLVAIGAGILFFGWFGFNVGGACFIPSSAFGAGCYYQTFEQAFSNTLNIGITAFVNSFIAMCMAILVWMIFDAMHKKHHTSLISILTAGVAGLATITPTAGFVPIWASTVIGTVGGIICYVMCKFNHKIHFDDALEVWPVHGIGGITGSLLVGAFACQQVNPILLNASNHFNNLSVAGSTISSSIGRGYLFGMQVGAVALVCAWTFVFSIGIFYLIKWTKNVATAEQQIRGLDEVYFEEHAYCDGFIDLNNNGIDDRLEGYVGTEEERQAWEKKQKDKENNKVNSKNAKKSIVSSTTTNKTAVTNNKKQAKAKKSTIDVNKKHEVVSIEEFNDYNYDRRRKEWHQKAGHNDEQVVCSICKDDDNWETVKLENGNHICYYCWIKKPANSKRVVKKVTVSK